MVSKLRKKGKWKGGGVLGREREREERLVKGGMENKEKLSRERPRLNATLPIRSGRQRSVSRRTNNQQPAAAEADVPFCTRVVPYSKS